MRKRQKCHFIRVGHCLMTMTTVRSSTSYAMFQRLGETLLRCGRRLSEAVIKLTASLCRILALNLMCDTKAYSHSL